MLWWWQRCKSCKLRQKVAGGLCSECFGRRLADFSSSAISPQHVVSYEISSSEAVQSMQQMCDADAERRRRDEGNAEISAFVQALASAIDTSPSDTPSDSSDAGGGDFGGGGASGEW